MKVLYIGGTGVISSACSQAAVDAGMELFLLNRGESKRPVPEAAKVLHGDVRDVAATRELLRHYSFDVVVDWIAYQREHIAADVEIFTGNVGQYVFISSASVYKKPPTILPITESTPLYNPFWQYSRDKIACEELLMQAFRERNFPVTIVRPSHTYDRTLLPFRGRYTVVDRMRRGEKVVVHGDGTSLWTLTHHKDFAAGFIGLLGNPAAIGEAFHITSDELLTWNQIFEIVAHAAGTKPKIVHVPSEHIAKFDPDWGASLLGDKSHSVVFDNSKIKRIVPDFKATIPFSRGAGEIIEWYDSNPQYQKIDEKFNALLERIIASWDELAH
ncbi:MAG: SDR family oxidoreductase [Calditrichaeota bacterium]|nr:SDR family oxidoreductase [Calditrichota bacterium]